MGKLVSLIITLVLASSSFASNIPTVIVNAKHPRRATIKAANPITVISQQQIQASGNNSFSELLQAEPNLVTRDLYSDGSKMTFSMRGFGDNANQNTLILLNGIPWLNPDLSAPDLSAISLSNVEQIEILPGSASVLYGDQAVGGVINIVTRPVAEQKSNAQVEFGQYGLQRYSASLANHDTNGFAYHLFGNYKQSHNYRQHNRLQQGNLSARIDYQENNNSVYLAWQSLVNNLELPGALTAAQVAQDRTQAQSLSDFSDRNINIIQAGIKQWLNQNWFFKADGDIKDMTGHGILTVPFNENGFNATIEPTLQGLLNLKKTSIGVITGLSLNTGRYHFIGQSYQSGAKLNEQAIYGQLDIPFFQHFEAIVGARQAWAQSELLQRPINHANRQAFVNSVGLIWHITRQLKFYLQRAESYRFPKADEDALTANNQLLKTQRGVSNEIGLNWHKKRITAGINAYILNLHNEIVFIPAINGVSFGSNQNLAKTRRYGYSANISYEVTHQWQLGGNVNFVHATLQQAPFAGSQIPLVPRYSWRAFSLLSLAPHWHWYLENVYLGSRYPGSDFANQTSKMPAYDLVNTNIAYSQKHYRLALHINNITNKHYNSYATVVSGNAGPITFFYPAIGRNVMLTLSVSA